jgi:hypothetical protein
MVTPITLPNMRVREFFRGRLSASRKHFFRCFSKILVLVAVASRRTASPLFVSIATQHQRFLFFFNSTFLFCILVEKMKPSIAATLAFFSCLCCSPAANGTSPSTSKKIAVVRPFSIPDSAKLSSSFAIWDDFPPCMGDPSYVADLVLVFSQSLENSTSAMKAMSEVGSMFEDNQGFGGCFERVIGFGCNIETSLDVYDPARSDDLWVNGPNRAFERTFRAMQAGGYDFFLQMEMDSVPIQSFWLDTLIHGSRDFAILGSRYRGYKWDSFYGDLPSSLRTHINGNAVYNTSHIVTERLVTVLESEAKTAGNTVPYDLRIAQILEEAKTGHQSSFHSSTALPSPPSYSNLFSDVKVEQSVRETDLIGNYASTNMVPPYLGSEIIIHGAKMYQPWNSSTMGNVSLIVSDWDPSTIQFLLKSLESSSHPFSEIVIMVPEESKVNSTAVFGHTPIRFVSRGKSSAWMDVCDAPVKTPWIMKTSSLFQLRQKVPLMTHQGKPVVTFSYPSKETCYNFRGCIDDMKRAKLMNHLSNRVFDELDMVYDRVSRDKFCSLVIHAHERPSPTEYVAYLDAMKKTEVLYHLSERRVTGLHAPFLRVPETLLPISPKGRGLQMSNSSNMCTNLASAEDCSNSGCEWIESTTSCRLNPNPIEGQPRIAPQSNTRPKYITALIIMSIAGASIALIALMYVAHKKQFGAGAGTSGSLEPLDGSRDPQNQPRSDIDSSLMLASDLDTSKPDSMQDIDLDDGRFEETSNGVEFVQN